MSAAWEQALQALVPSHFKVADRDAFAGNDSPSWIATVDYLQQARAGNRLLGDKMPGDPANTWDVYLKFKYESSKALTVGADQGAQGWNWGYLYIGVNLDYSQFGAGSTWSQILAQGKEILDPVATIAPFENTAGNQVVASQPSVDFYIKQLQDTQTAINQWAADFEAQAKSVGSGQGFSGEAAKTYQSKLEDAVKKLRRFGEDVANPRMIAELQKAKDALSQYALQLLNAFTAWRPDLENKEAFSLSSPRMAVAEALRSMNLMMTYSSVGEVREITAGGTNVSVESEEFKKKLDRAAKDLWNSDFVQKLDAPAAQAMGTANGKFEHIPRGFPNVRLGQITATYQPTSGGGADDDFKKKLQQMQEENQKLQQDNLKQQGDFQKQQQDDYKQQQEDLDKQKQDELEKQNELNKTDLTPDENGLGGDKKPGDDTDPPDLDNLDEVEDQNKELTQNLTDGNGNGTNSLNEDKNVPPPSFLTGSGSLGLGNNNPLGGTTYDPNNPGGQSSVFNPDGSVARGPDGTPLTVPNGSKINANGTITKPDGTLLTGPDGKPIKVDPDSAIRPNQMLRNPDGTFATGPDGRPLYGPYGSSVNPHGQVLDPKGNLVLGPNGKFLGAVDPSGGPFKNKIPLNSPFGTKTVGPTGPPEIGDPTKRSTANSSALDDALRKQSTPVTETGPKGRGSGANGQSPVMPPPMGGGGAPGGQEKERQRNTWLTEDPEKWGSQGGFTTAIGR
ncbi:hypothetical protein AB0L88_38315 [Saccharopolyspora shandongensis]|uniref:hypothetical protein n=1 Tax=Saccharopolyspora shandongensis TaxID=418495 RepID=UPI00342FC39F